MRIRDLGAVFFLLYGALVPIAATEFTEENLETSLAIVGSCVVIALLLWCGRAVLLNILIAFYVFRVYLTRPYVDVFLPRLNDAQTNYIASLNAFYSPTDAIVVYVSLFSLLFAWLLGLLAAQPKSLRKIRVPWVFRRVDSIVAGASWQFWLAWASLSALNYKAAPEMWQGIATGESSGLFAFGLFSTATINMVCLAVFVRSRQPGEERVSIFLLAPVLVPAILGVWGGSRSAIFAIVVFALSFWLFLNFSKRLSSRDMKRVILLVPILALTVVAGLFAQLLRPLLRSGAQGEEASEKVYGAMDLADPDNPLFSSIHYGMTELLHRLSSLKAQFRIMNDHFVHDPRDHYNPMATLMRIINDLVPGDVFSGMLTINQLFDYIYYDALVTYNSETWSIQGTLYLYFGYWVSPIIVFGIAVAIGRYYSKLGALVKASPAFAVFFILLFNDFIENGTLERIIPIDVVRPLTSFIGLILVVSLLKGIFSVERRIDSPSK